MRDHSSRFIDNQKIFVFVQDWNVDGFGESDRARRLRNVVFEEFALFERTAGFDNVAVDGNVAAFDSGGYHRS